MASVVDYVEDVEIHTTEQGTEIVREKGISAKSARDIIEDKLIPGYGTRHPDFPQMRLVSGTVSRTGNDGGKWQGWWRGTYSSRSSDISSNQGKDPWELDAHEYSVNPLPMEIPMRGGYDPNGKYAELKNTAGGIINRTYTFYGAEHSFIFCLKDKGRRPEFNQQAIINSSTVKIASETFEKQTAMLLPPSVNLRLEYDDRGNVTRSYWEIAVKIQYNPNTWAVDSLNVGTMAKFGKKNIPETIYRYYPWKNSNPAVNFDTTPEFGCLADVAKAKHRYAQIVSGGVINDKYHQAYKELPWEEVTEPLPLDKDGKIYLPAMQNPAKNKYYVIRLFPANYGSFSSFDLPRKREGD